MTEQEIRERLVNAILLEKRGWAERLPVVRQEMHRLDINQFELTAWLREHGVRSARGPISIRTVARWISGDYVPDADAQDAIIDMLVEASLGNWSKARYVSWDRVVDLIRPKTSPQWQDVTVGQMALVGSS